MGKPAQNTFTPEAADLTGAVGAAEGRVVVRCGERTVAVPSRPKGRGGAPATGNVYVPPTAVTVSASGAFDAYPTAAPTPRGIVCVFGISTDVSETDGVLRQVVSPDGWSWDDEGTIVDDSPTYAANPGSLTYIDGKLFLVYSRYNGTTFSILLRTSTDDGRTYGAPVAVDAGFTLNNHNCGKIFRTPAGRLGMPVFGKNVGDTYDHTAILYSSDGGRTWPVRVAVFGNGSDAQYNEMTVGPLADGTTLLALARNDAPVNGKIVRGTSTDDGETFTGPTDTGLAVVGGSPNWVLTDSGAVVVWARSSANGNKGGLFTSRDGGVTWSSVALLPAALSRMGQYADLLQLDAGVILCVFAQDSSDTVCQVNACLVFDGGGAGHGRSVATGVNPQRVTWSNDGPVEHLLVPGDGGHEFTYGVDVAHGFYVYRRDTGTYELYSGPSGDAWAVTGKLGIGAVPSYYPIEVAVPALSDGGPINTAGEGNLMGAFAAGNIVLGRTNTAHNAVLGIASNGGALLVVGWNGSTNAEWLRGISGRWVFGGGSDDGSNRVQVTGSLKTSVAVQPGSFTVATVPSGTEGQRIHVTNARKPGEGAGSGTGVPATYTGGAWRSDYDQLAVAA